MDPQDMSKIGQHLQAAYNMCSDRPQIQQHIREAWGIIDPYMNATAVNPAMDPVPNMDQNAAVAQTTVAQATTVPQHTAIDQNVVVDPNHEYHQDIQASDFNAFSADLGFNHQYSQGSAEAPQQYAQNQGYNHDIDAWLRQPNLAQVNTASYGQPENSYQTHYNQASQYPHQQPVNASESFGAPYNTPNAFVGPPNPQQLTGDTPLFTTNPSTTVDGSINANHSSQGVLTLQGNPGPQPASNAAPRGRVPKAKTIICKDAACGKRFTSKWEADRHFGYAHLAKRCEWCGVEFRSVSHLGKHILDQHTNGDKKFCPKCNKKNEYLRIGQFYEHIVGHMLAEGEGEGEGA